MLEKTNVVERMRVVLNEKKMWQCQMRPTFALKGDLRKSNRGAECLKHTLWKSEVFCFPYVNSAKPSQFKTYLFFSLRLQVQNNILVTNLVHSTLKINELETIRKKVSL
jgi:hypothetical protein